jgi:hypothetical protein
MADRISRNGGTTVTVGLKLPAGLILQVYEMADDWEGTPAGPRTIKKAKKISIGGVGQVVLKGYADPLKDMTKFLPFHKLNHNVPKEFMDLWLTQNKDSDLLANGLLVVHATDTKGAVKEVKDQRCGLEALIPPPQIITKRNRDQLDPRVRSLSRRIGVTTAEEQYITPVGMGDDEDDD